MQTHKSYQGLGPKLFAFLALLLASSVAADAVPEHSRLWELARAHNVDLKLAALNRRAIQARQQRSDILLPSNPGIQIERKQGSVRTGPVFDPQLSGPLLSEKRSVRGLEFGLSQEFEVAGQRALRKQEVDLELAEQAASYEARAREVFFGIPRALAGSAIAERLTRIIQSQIVAIQQVSAAYRSRGLRDTKLGNYTVDAMGSDVAMLTIERNAAESRKKEFFSEIDLLVGTRVNLGATPSEPGSSVSLPEPPSIESLERNIGPENPFVRENLIRAKRGVVAKDLATRSIFPNITVFTAIGQEKRGTGTGPGFALSPFTSGPQGEQDRYFRAGVRIPIPVWDRGQGLVEEAEAKSLSSSVSAEAIQSRIAARVRVLLARYANLRSSLQSLELQSRSVKGIYYRLDTAFLSGRLSYSEYWSERSRWMNIERSVWTTLQEAIETRTALEILTGFDFASGRAFVVE